MSELSSQTSSAPEWVPGEAITSHWAALHWGYEAVDPITKECCELPDGIVPNRISIDDYGKPTRYLEFYVELLGKMIHSGELKKLWEWLAEEQRQLCSIKFNRGYVFIETFLDCAIAEAYRVSYRAEIDYTKDVAQRDCLDAAVRLLPYTYGDHNSDLQRVIATLHQHIDPVDLRKTMGSTGSKTGQGDNQTQPWVEGFCVQVILKIRRRFPNHPKQTHMAALATLVAKQNISQNKISETLKKYNA